jgi:hypothetical protein
MKTQCDCGRAYLDDGRRFVCGDCGTVFNEQKLEPSFAIDQQRDHGPLGEFEPLSQTLDVPASDRMLAHRRKQCERCNKRDRVYCSVLRNRGQAGFIEHPKGLLDARSQCPDTPQRWFPSHLTWFTEDLVIDEPLVPSKPRLVITMAIGDKAQEMLQYTGPQMQSYADRCGADFVAIADDGAPGFPIANKWRLHQLARNYDRVLFVDSDLWIKNDTPNVFDIVPRGKIGIYCEYGGLRDIKNLGWLDAESQQTAMDTGQEFFPTESFNTGFVVFDGGHSDIWEPPWGAIRRRHLAEQTCVEYRIKQHEYSVHRLPILWNTQYWMDGFEEKSKDAHCIHLSTCSHGERIARLQALVFLANTGH